MHKKSPLQLTLARYWQVSDDVNVLDSVHSRRSFSVPAQLMSVKAVRLPTSSRDTLAPTERMVYIHIRKYHRGSFSLPHHLCIR